MNNEVDTRLIDDKGGLNINLFTVLTHTSIASSIPPFDFFDVDDAVQREREREMWQAYAREFAMFYLDIFVDYVQAVITQGTYQTEDVIVFREVIGK